MKNYLFAPFKDDEEKIEEFNHFKNYLSSGHRNSLIMFIGRLESYYDAIISKLQAEDAESMGWIEQYKTSCKNYHEEIKALHKERDDLFKACKLLKADNKELKADIIHDANVSYDLDDKHVEIIKRLEVEKDALLVANGELLQSNLKLRKDNGVLDGFKEGSE